MTCRVPLIYVAALASTVLAFGACGHVEVTHVPPGQSLNVALAKKPEVVRLPAPPPSAIPPPMPGTSGTSPTAGVAEGDHVARVAEAFSRGQFCMNAGKDDEAIIAFQEVVKLDPTFTEAWQNLAALYEKKGDNKKAIEAFRRAKKIARQ